MNMHGTTRPTFFVFLVFVGVVFNGCTLKGSGGPNQSKASQVVKLTAEIGKSASATVIIQNTAGEEVLISEASFSRAEFSSKDGGDCPSSLPVGGKCSFLIEFKPEKEGPVQGFLAFGDFIGARFVGTGIKADVNPAGSLTLNLNISVYDFGYNLLNIDAPTFEFQVSNRTTASLNATPAVTMGPFTVLSNQCPQMLPAQGNCSFRVGFKPTVLGSVRADISVGVGANAVTAVVTGNGVATPRPVLTIDRFVNDFGSHSFGSQTIATFVVKNTGTVPMTYLGGTGYGGYGAVVFNLRFNGAADCFSSPLAPGATCNIYVSYDPDASSQDFDLNVAGSQNSGTFDFTSNSSAGPGNTVRVTLTGIGVP